MSFNENSFKERCQKYFGTDSVYAILGIREGSNVSEGKFIETTSNPNDCHFVYYK